MNMIEIRDLTKVYRGKKESGNITAISQLDLVVDAGEVFGFLGPNGAGKSTTIKILAGLITATTGTASLRGIPVSESASRQHIGYLPENPSFYDFLTAREYLTFVGRSFSMREQDILGRSEHMLRLTGIYDASDRPLRSYSKGMVQRLGLAQTLLHDPDIYILDEPMSGLDPLGRALVKDILRDLKEKGKTIFFSTHITSDVETVCDRVGVIVGGKLLAVDHVESILRRGIEGYHVQIRSTGPVDEVFQGYAMREGAMGIKEIIVPKAMFREFLAKVSALNVEIELIEPKRKNLESFFLEIVEKHAS